MNTYRKYNTYGRLRTVLLGTYFYPEFFSKIKNPKVREPMMRIAQEINEDLDYFHQVLQNFGCQVLRADQPAGYFDEENPYLPPLQTRNTHAVVGDRLYQINEDFYNALDPIYRAYCPDITNIVAANNSFFKRSTNAAIQSYNPQKDIWYSKLKYQEMAGSSWPNYLDYVAGFRSADPNIAKELEEHRSVLEYETKEFLPLQGPNIVNTDHTIYVDANEYCDYSNWLRKHIIDPRPIRQFNTKAAHCDGCFAVLGNNVILGIDPLIDYKKYFPGYTIIGLNADQYSVPIKDYKVMKTKVAGKWWLAGEEHNDEFIGFVESKLKNWLGYISESVFDVNVLALDENTVCTLNVSPEIEKQLRSSGIECILVPWRHRFFVDCGLHCLTLDLYRD